MPWSIFRTTLVRILTLELMLVFFFVTFSLIGLIFSSYCHSGDPSCRPSVGFRKGCKIQRWTFVMQLMTYWASRKSWRLDENSSVWTPCRTGWKSVMSKMLKSIFERGKRRKCQENWKQVQLLQHRQRQGEWWSLLLTQSRLVWILGFNSSNICTKLLASCWTLKRSWLLTLLTLMTCRENVQILRQHFQTTSTVLVLWMKYKTVEFLSADVRRSWRNSSWYPQVHCVMWWKWRISQLESGTADSVDSVYFCCWLRTFVLQDETHYDLRSTMTEGRLTTLAILSIEKETVEQVDFTKLIEYFAAVRVRKVLI